MTERFLQIVRRNLNKQLSRIPRLLSRPFTPAIHSDAAGKGFFTNMIPSRNDNNPYAPPQSAGMKAGNSTAGGRTWRILGWFIGLLGAVTAIGNLGALALQIAKDGVGLADPRILDLENYLMSICGGASWVAAGVYWNRGKRLRPIVFIAVGVLIGFANFACEKLLWNHFYDSQGMLRSASNLNEEK